MTPPLQRCAIRFRLILIFLCLTLTALCSPALAAPMVTTMFVTFPEAGAADAWGLAMPTLPKETIKDRGFCWSTTPLPTKNCSGLGPGHGFYSLPLSGIKSGYTFYVRAYARTALGVTYGNQISFHLPPPFIPTAVTAEPVPTGPTTAILGGDATHEGHAEILERGVCWSTTPLPDFHDKCQVMGAGLGSFSGAIGGFTSGTSYYVRAYAASDIGTGWGADKVFATKQHDHDPPTVSTAAPYNETDVSALSGGHVTNQGSSAVTARGVCWSTSSSPTVEDDSTNDGTGLGRFQSYLTGLKPLTEYHVRAYATNDAGTSYGEEYKFKTVHPTYPKVSTVGALEVFDDSAFMQGEVVLTGDATVDERGFCWSETPRPTIADNVVLEGGSGAGMYQAMLDCLRPETLYYARAFVRNQYGVFYGHIIYFKTSFSKYPAR